MVRTVVRRFPVALRMSPLPQNPITAGFAAFYCSLCRGGYTFRTLPRSARRMVLRSDERNGLLTSTHSMQGQERVLPIHKLNMKTGGMIFSTEKAKSK